MTNYFFLDGNQVSNQTCLTEALTPDQEKNNSNKNSYVPSLRSMREKEDFISQYSLKRYRVKSTIAIVTGLFLLIIE